MNTVLHSGLTKVLMVDSFRELSYELGNIGKNTVWVFDSKSALMVRPLPEPNVILESGPSSKKFASVQRILECANENKFTEDATFLAIGGGVVSDVTGFASALWMYGSKLVLVPTTLVAMADACVGGVTTIDFKSTRNRVGIIHPAETVIICTDTLKSLSKTDFMNGLSVIIKHSFLSEDESLGKTMILEKQKVLAQDEKVIQNIISLSLRVKANYTEPVKRPLLELGEALACDLQLLYPSRFSYGKALAWGMCRSAEIAIDTGKCSQQYGQSIIRLYQSYGFDTQFRIPRTQWQEMRSVINRDRSYSDRNYRFVLPVNQGKTEITEIDEDTIRKAVIENVVF